MRVNITLWLAGLILAALGILQTCHGFLGWLNDEAAIVSWIFGAAALILGTIALILVCIADYRAWIALGEGGLPSNLRGWLTVTAMRPLAGDPLDQSVFSSRLGSEADVAYLDCLPGRDMPRPTVAPHAVPHRQIDQFPDTATMSDLSAAFDDIVAKNAARLQYKLSRHEKHNQAIWLQDVDGGNPATGKEGEIGHFHPSDGSMHTILSPSDAKQVIDKGWGELHSMARFKRIFPTDTFLMLYAPAKPEHVPVIKSIILAATRYALPVHDNQLKG
ncbi:luciferase domain-containing protein [Leisingera sp. NJS204]|uniref:luciferase domain-containing protein n=1 Tax=Leisingera sp. NJS204 TaxID=2508307 RepID=UPI001011DE0E|nr:luciferase family protein [Leisingera sp. NJS204]QAX28732.1 hypothetical protein ETW24_04715 [Leisingera sp. NJS204]